MPNCSCLFPKGDQWVRQITQNELTFDFNTDDIPKGSTFAFNSAKTTDGSTFLAINTHQPLDGPVFMRRIYVARKEPIF